jgi:hypothetical protein
MSNANPLWVHRASMASCSNSVSRSVKPPSASTWCEDLARLRRAGGAFLRNEAIGIAAIDMFVVASATFRLLFVTLILAHDRRKIVRYRCHAASDRRLVVAPGDRSIPVGHRAALFAARSRRLVRPGFPQPGCRISLCTAMLQCPSRATGVRPAS